MSIRRRLRRDLVTGEGCERRLRYHGVGLVGRSSLMEAVMHKARSFFFVCAGFLWLAIAYHRGARSANAQSAGNPVVAMCPEGNTGWIIAMTASGDTYRTTNSTPSRT